MIYGFVNHGSDASLKDWALSICGIGCILLMTWQSVKSIMHDMTRRENTL